MSKDKSIFVCGECGYETGKWLGKCPSCGSWNTMVEAQQVPSQHRGAVAPTAVALSDVEPSGAKRVSTGIGELDRVLGGGVVGGSAVLLGGDPGIGKSTLLMQAAARLTELGRVLYVTGEESAAQLKLRAERLGVGGSMLILAETDLNLIEAALAEVKPSFLIVDSIQTMYNTELPGAAGSVSQVREATSMLTRYAKTSGMAVFIVGHVTKEGAIAGPRVLEHMVDTVLYFEGDRHDVFRILRAVKNRFGSTNEIGVFEMLDTGMAEVTDPAAVFLSGTAAAGCAVTCAMEGTRPMMAEVQALLSDSPFNNPRRMAAGLDNNRLILLLAVLEKKAGLKLNDKDVYSNVVGGLRLEERSADLAVVMSVASALMDIPLPPATAVIGEVSLTGHIRPVSRLEQRIRECARLGFTNVIIPSTDSPIKTANVTVTQVATVAEAAAILTAAKLLRR